MFVVEDVDAEYARLLDEGVEVTTRIETEEWGEPFFQVTDPCGVVYQHVTWVGSSQPSSVSAPLLNPGGCQSG